MNTIKFKEAEMHPFLVYFAHQQFGCHCKTIKEGESTNQKAGDNEWLHPDLVGFKLLRNDFVEKVQSFYRHMNQDVAYLYSFELKREVKLSDLKKSYFQAVSNSSWANEGYLVAARLDTENKRLMNEIERLVQAFGIGVILLDLNQIEESRVLFEAKKKTELDFYTINKLIEQNNEGFGVFIEVINSCLEAKNVATEEAIIKQRMDKVYKSTSIGSNSMEVDFSTDNSKPKECEIVSSGFFVDLNRKDYTFHQVVSLKINNKIIPLENWRTLFTEMAKYCKELDPRLFKEHCYLIEGTNHYLFFRNSPQYWETEKCSFHRIEDRCYIYCYGSANELVRQTRKMVKVFGIPLESISIQIEPTTQK